MGIITTIMILVIVFFFYRKSKSNFFLQDKEMLYSKKLQVISLLEFKGVKNYEEYITAYDYFCKYPHKFDGATIVKDLHDIKGLDLKAMLHDYECLMGANSSFKLWYKSAFKYYLNHFEMGNGNQLLRFIGLSILGIGFVPYCWVKNHCKKSIKEI